MTAQGKSRDSPEKMIKSGKSKKKCKTCQPPHQDIMRKASQWFEVMFFEVWYETRGSYVLYNFRWKTAIRIIHSPSHLCFSFLSVGFFLLPHLFICLLISSVLPSFLPSFNILWSGSTIAKSFSPPPNASITLYNPAAWLSESRKSTMCLTWAHRLYPSPKLAQTEVFITEHEWAQKREKEWMERQRRQLIQ